MAYSDLEYGWSTLYFDLRDVQIFSGIEMEVRDSAGTWKDRQPSGPLIELEETRNGHTSYEHYEAVRYTAPSRYLTATAVLSPVHSTDTVLLGIPEDKKNRDHSSSTSRTSRLSTVSLRIGEDEEDERDLREGLPGPSTFSRLHIYGAGRFYHQDPDEDQDGGTHAVFDVPSDAFDQIQTLFARPNVAVHYVRINIKCWHWIDFSGDREVYISRANTEKEPAELAGLVVREIVANVSVATENEGDQAAVPEVRGTQLLNAIAGIQLQNASIRRAAWLSAVSAALIATYLIFS